MAGGRVRDRGRGVLALLGMVAPGKQESAPNMTTNFTHILLENLVHTSAKSYVPQNRWYSHVSRGVNITHC